MTPLKNEEATAPLKAAPLKPTAGLNGAALLGAEDGVGDGEGGDDGADGVDADNVGSGERGGDGGGKGCGVAG
jgi:hypothetical protein